MDVAVQRARPLSGLSLVDWLRCLDADLTARTRLNRRLPLIALLIGMVWVVGIGMRFGIRMGGDSGRYMTYASRFQTGEMTYPQIFKTRGNAHSTYLWMAWLGPQGFVWATALLTIGVPLWLLMILRRCGVGTLGCLGALAYAGANPELYQWAWFVLSDGFFIMQTIVLLWLIVRPTYPRWVFWLSPLVLYSFLFNRPMSVALLPGLLLFALLTPERRARSVWLVLTFLAAIGISAVVMGNAVGGDAVEELSAGVRRNFIRGQLVEAPARPAVPLPTPFTEADVEGRTLGELCRADPGYCLGYFSKKLLAFLVPVYPWYSLRHRLFNLIYFGSLLLLTVGSFILLAWAVIRQRGSAVELSHLRWRTWLLLGVSVLAVTIFHTATLLDSDARYLIGWTLPWIGWAFLQLDMALATVGLASRAGG